MASVLKPLAVLLSSCIAEAVYLFPPYVPVTDMMKSDKSRAAQLMGCAVLVVDSSSKAEQAQAAGDGAIDAIAGAMDLFPEDKALIASCTMSLATIILFNRANGLRAGQLGCLNHTLHVYMRNMDDPTIMGLGGAIGAYFDFVDENRLIARELGGIQAIIQNIKNHFHGKYGEWTYNPVKQSLFALSSGCHVNEDVCFREGFPELAVKLMAEHGGEDKIAEETLQVTRALISKSNVYRQRLVDLGMASSLVHVMQVNPHDRGALDLTCINVAMLVGGSPLHGSAFSRTIQARALASGALGEVLKVVAPGREMHHKEHGGFNFDVDASYNVKKDCFDALAALGRENPPAVAQMSRAGLAATVAADLGSGPADHYEVVAGCSLVSMLSAVEHTVQLQACAK